MLIRGQRQSKIVFVLATRRLFVAPILSITFTPRREMRWRGSTLQTAALLPLQKRPGRALPSVFFFFYIQRRRTRNQNASTSCAIAAAHTSSGKKKCSLCLRVVFVQVKLSNKKISLRISSALLPSHLQLLRFLCRIVAIHLERREGH